MAHLAPEARVELDGIWDYVEEQSGSPAVADKVVFSITKRFAALTQYPYMGRRRNDLGPGLFSFPVGKYIILYRIEDDVRIVHVFHGSRDIARLM